MTLLYTVSIDNAGIEHIAIATGMMATTGGTAFVVMPPLAGRWDTFCQISYMDYRYNLHISQHTLFKITDTFSSMCLIYRFPQLLMVVAQTALVVSNQHLPVGPHYLVKQWLRPSVDFRLAEGIIGWTGAAFHGDGSHPDYRWSRHHNPCTDRCGRKEVDAQTPDDDNEVWYSLVYRARSTSFMWPKCFNVSCIVRWTNKSFIILCHINFVNTWYNMLNISGSLYDQQLTKFLEIHGCHIYINVCRAQIYYHNYYGSCTVNLDYVRCLTKWLSASPWLFW